MFIADTTWSHVKHGDDWVFFNDEKVVKAPLTSAAKEGDEDVGVKGLIAQAYVYFFEARLKVDCRPGKLDRSCRFAQEEVESLALNTREAGRVRARV